MDFGIEYSTEQQTFRSEVRDWLNANIPEDKRALVDMRDFDYDQFLFWRELHRKMGEKGWLFPTFPAEYGGGGLSGDHEVVIEEEMKRIGAVEPLKMVMIGYLTERMYSLVIHMM